VDLRDAQRDWSALELYQTSVYVNFLMDEGDEPIRQAYGHAKYERLKALKRTYDPTNLFRLNQNIPPDRDCVTLPEHETQSTSASGRGDARAHGRSTMSGSLCIRTATPDEAAVLLEIQEASSIAGFGHVFPPDKFPFPSEAVLDRWQKAVDDPAEVVVLAELDRDAVGFAAMRAEWLDALYVVPSCWGVGVGPRLHDHALTWIRDLGCKRCHLWVLEQNARARRFYEKRGWRLNGDTRIVPFPPYPTDVGYTIEL
jgi:GNAT superfamily N-acetyltransferase